MIIINDWRDMPAELGGACVAMGNFDGVHLGHAEVLRWAKARAQSIGAPLGLVTFEPHPRRFLNPTAAPFMIAARGQKEEALERLGIERLYRLRFDADLASMMADDFVSDVLWSGLKVREISVGFDFNFGKNRSGSAESLKALGDSLGMPVHVAEAVSALGQGKCSSSAIRAALIAGKPEDAAAMLGRPFAIRGEVVHGQKIGRTIGFPTANLELGDYVRPADGIYATRTRLPDGRTFASAAYIGKRPTVNGVDERLEVNLFDFDEDLYGQVLETEFIAFIRGDMKFNGLEELKRQIFIDCTNIWDILRNRD